MMRSLLFSKPPPFTPEAGALRLTLPASLRAESRGVFAPPWQEWYNGRALRGCNAY